MNQVNLMGNITKDLEMRYLPNGTAILSFSIAVNRRYKDKDGKAVDKPSFIDCKAWAKTAEFINQYWSKGKRILLIGRLEQETWQDKESGKNRSKIVVIVDKVFFTESAKKDAPQEVTPEEAGMGDVI